MKVKKDLKDLNPTDLNFSEGTQLFINETLFPCYRVLWNKHKKLWINKKKRMMFLSKIWAKKPNMIIFQKYRLNDAP